MKKITFLLFVWLNLIPAWGQLFSPKQIEEIQEFYLNYETNQVREKNIKVPYKLPSLRTGWRVQRPEDFEPYFWKGDSSFCATSNTLRDTLRFGGKDILIFDSPLLDFPEIEEIVLPNKVTFEGFFKLPFIVLNAFRGYTAQWSIENDSLFLLQVTPYHGAYFEGDSVTWEIIQPDIAELVGQRFINGKLFAGWVNGIIIGGTNGIYLKRELGQYEQESVDKMKLSPEKILWRQYTGHYIYPEEYSFWIENGIVIQNDHLRKE